ncbi:hypothetical protein MLD38_027554 [Melastoma candidum]|uniref:Uncharacterized protein n=1 Tax=Melastoma candidum TaxID=119954 RepID=A0ACB9P3W2_9MYRT|nr:hypothetical protein MLD38_027554 [Melastoma candidum]
MVMTDGKDLCIAMYPWFAFGHLTSFLHLANKLAVPHVDGLPPGSETTADVPVSLHHLLMTAMDLTRPAIDASLFHIRPDIVFFDFTHWLPAVAWKLGIKSVHYCTVSCATVSYTLSPRRNLLKRELVESDLMEPPPGFPSSSIRLSAFESRDLTIPSLKEYGSGISFLERQLTSLSDCDAIAFPTFREIEGPYVAYLESKLNKPILLAGILPRPPSSSLEERMLNWLNRFDPQSVIYCAFGSECVLREDQFQELIHGLELTQKPFFATLKPPVGAESVDSALPPGLMDNIHGRGVIHEGWVQQPLVLEHPSVGCFMTHCGSGSLWEGMISNCQLVLLPHKGDQFINARMLSSEQKVGVLVERMEDGGFSRDTVCEAIMTVMDEDNDIGKEVRKNHNNWKELLLREGLEDSYMEEFVGKLHGLLEA